MELNPIDISYLVVLAYGVIKGLQAGFVRTILLFLKIGVALSLALRFSGLASVILTQLFRVNADFSPILGFFLMLGVISASFYVLGIFIEHFINAVSLGVLNKVLGMILWSGILSTAYSAVLNLLEKGNVIPYEMIQNSYIYSTVQPILQIIMCKMENLIPYLNSIIQSLKILLSQITNLIIGQCIG